MNAVKIIRNALSFEIAPVKYDCDQQQSWGVCDVIDAVGWSVYGCMPDGTKHCINDFLTQGEAVDFVRRSRNGRAIYFNTRSEGISELNALPGKPAFTVLAGITGDNGAFKPCQAGDVPDRWILAAFRKTGEYSHTYTELGSYHNRDAAYFSLSATLDLMTSSYSHMVIARAMRVADGAGGHIHPKWVIWDNEDFEEFGIFKVDSSNTAQCVYHAQSLSEIVSVLPEYNGENAPVLLNAYNRVSILTLHNGTTTEDQLHMLERIQ